MDELNCSYVLLNAWLPGTTQSLELQHIQVHVDNTQYIMCGTHYSHMNSSNDCWIMPATYTSHGTPKPQELNSSSKVFAKDATYITSYTSHGTPQPHEFQQSAGTRRQPTSHMPSSMHMIEGDRLQRRPSHTIVGTRPIQSPQICPTLQIAIASPYFGQQTSGQHNLSLHRHRASSHICCSRWS